MASNNPAARIQTVIPTPAELVARAEAMIPVLRERAARQEAERRILAETMADLKQAGFFKILQPARWGGWEMDPGTFFEVQIALAKGDPSVGWVYGILGVHSFHLALFDDQAARDVWSENDAILIASPYSPGKAVPVEGGFRLTGRWKFSSGTEHCDWIFLGGLVEGETLPGRTFLLPRRDYEIVDTWKVVGLKGTGSQDIVVNDMFVPEHRTHRVIDAATGRNPGAEVNRGVLFQYPFWQVFLRAVSTGAIGGLEGMLEAFIDYGRSRVSVTGMATTADPDALLAIAEAKSAIDEMKGTLHRNFDRMRPYAEKRELPPVEDRYLWKYQCITVVRRCTELALPLFRAAGGSGVFATQPFGRFYTDLLAMGNHAANTYQPPGRAWGGSLLGLPTQDFIV